MSTQKEKVNRILSIYHRLLQGNVIYKLEEAERYDVSVRSIQRDIDDIRDYMVKEAEYTGVVNTIAYNKTINGYKLEYVCCVNAIDTIVEDTSW